MSVEDTAKEASLSAKTVARRLEKMRENHILEFSILTTLSSMQLILVGDILSSKASSRSSKSSSGSKVPKSKVREGLTG